MLKRNFHKRVLLYGSPRSGTTWLAEIVNSTNRYRLIFEPFHAGQSTDWNGFGFQAVVPDSSSKLNQKRLSKLNKILNGKISKNNTWSKRYLGGHNYLKQINKGVAVKSVRCHFMIDAVYDINPKTRTIAIIRNPFDTIQSQHKSGFLVPDNILKHKRINFMREGDVDLVDLYVKKAKKSDASLFVLRWVSETLAIMKERNKRRSFIITKYEDLVANTEVEASKILIHLNIDVDIKKIVEASQKKSSTAKLSRKNKQEEKFNKEVKRCIKVANNIFDLGEFEYKQ